MTRPAEFIVSTLVVAVTTLATLVMLEYIVRWTIPAFDPSGHVSFVPAPVGRPALGEPNSVQRQIKNTGDYDVTIRFNKYGFRDDRDFAHSTRDDYFAVGDSLAFGWGVEETDRVTEQLEKMIARPIYNISIPLDIDGAEKLVDYAEAQGAKIGNLIYLFSTEARIRNYDVKPTGSDAAGENTDGAGRRHYLSVKYWLADNSALYFLFTSFVHRTPALRDLAIAAGLIQPNLEGFSIRDYNPRDIESTANRLARFVEREDRRVILVVLPSRTLWIGPSRDIEDRISRTLIDRLQDMGLEVVDVRPYFEAGGNPFKYYFKNDPHWNAAGHRQVALAIARHLGATAEVEPQ